MPATKPDIARGVFGLPENDLPSGGMSRTAVWAVIESAPGRPLGSIIARLRRQLAWLSMRNHATSIVELELVNAPAWAKRSVAKARSAAGLEPAVLR